MSTIQIHKSKIEEYADVLETTKLPLGRWYDSEDGTFCANGVLLHHEGWDGTCKSFDMYYGIVQKNLDRYGIKMSWLTRLNMQGKSHHEVGQWLHKQIK